MSNCQDFETIAADVPARLGARPEQPRHGVITVTTKGIQNMPKSQNQLAANADTRDMEHPALILERQVMNTHELRRHVHQVRIRMNDVIQVELRRLFDGMSTELQIFVEMIRKRLESSCRDAQYFTKEQSGPSWHSFPSDNLDVRGQLELLLCAYATYARKTSKAIATLRRREELECRKLLEGMFVAADRHMSFLEMCLEGLVLNTDIRRLPTWPAGGMPPSVSSIEAHTY
jgi:hypothetical protein